MMSSLVPGGLFSTPGLNCHSTPTHPQTTPEELDQLYARQAFNGRPWPCDGHVAGMYDVRNTSTNMIILNNKYGEGFSRLRGYYCPSGERIVDIERHFEDRPRNLFNHLRCFDSSLSSFPPKEVERGLARAYRSENPPDTLEDAIKGLLPTGSTYRTLYPPHLRNQFQKHVENLRNQSQKLPKIVDSKAGQRKSSLRLTSSTNVRRASSVKAPLLVVNHRRLSEYTPSFYGFFESTGDVTEAFEKAKPAFSKTSVTSSNKSEESAFLASPSKSGESAFSITSLPEIEYSHYKGEGVERPKSRLGRPEEAGKSRNIQTSRSTEVTLMVLKELESKSMENAKQEENLMPADDERKSVQSHGSDSVENMPSCQSEDKKETEPDNLEEDEAKADQTDDIYRESDNSQTKELEAEDYISTTNVTQQSAEQKALSEIPNLVHTEEIDDVDAEISESHLAEYQTMLEANKSRDSIVPDSKIMDPDETKPHASQLESTDNYLKSDPADNLADTKSSESETEEEPGTREFPTKPLHYAPQSDDTAGSSRSAKQENKNAGSKNNTGAKNKNCSVL